MQCHADSGKADAQLHLADAHRGGRFGLLKDARRAVHLYEMAAFQGHARAEDKLGCCYVAGDGVQTDFEKAFMWFSKAAAQGFPTAMYNVGVLCFLGQGVEQSYSEAVKWYALAASKGHRQAIASLACAALEQRAAAAEAVCDVEKGLETRLDGPPAHFEQRQSLQPNRKVRGHCANAAAAVRRLSRPVAAFWAA
jgi:TPR repeat protein